MGNYLKYYCLQYCSILKNIYIYTNVFYLLFLFSLKICIFVLHIMHTNTLICGKITHAQCHVRGGTFFFLTIGIWLYLKCLLEYTPTLKTYLKLWNCYIPHYNDHFILNGLIAFLFLWLFTCKAVFLKQGWTLKRTWCFCLRVSLWNPEELVMWTNAVIFRVLWLHMAYIQH